jgi:hypothetical protein
VLTLARRLRRWDFFKKSAAATPAARARRIEEHQTHWIGHRVNRRQGRGDRRGSEGEDEHDSREYASMQRARHGEREPRSLTRDFVENRKNVPVFRMLLCDETAAEHDRVAMGHEINALSERGTHTSLGHTRSPCNFPR